MSKWNQSEENCLNTLNQYGAFTGGAFTDQNLVFGIFLQQIALLMEVQVLQTLKR